jgi:hypothetical protein
MAATQLGVTTTDSGQLKKLKKDFGKRAKFASKVVGKLAKTSARLREIEGMDPDQALFVAAELLGVNIGSRGGH